MRGARSIRGDHRPAVGELLREPLAPGDHRLDRQRHPGAQRGTLAGRAVVPDRRFHVHLGADAVAGVLADQPVLARGADRMLDRMRDVTKASPWHCLPDARPHRLLACVEERLIRRLDLADADGERRVSMPPVQDRPAVNGEHVPRLQPGVLPGDAVHDDLVDGGADTRWIPEVAKERGHRPRGPDLALRDRVEVTRAYPGAHRLPAVSYTHLTLPT